MPVSLVLRAPMPAFGTARCGEVPETSCSGQVSRAANAFLGATCEPKTCAQRGFPKRLGARSAFGVSVNTFGN